MPLLWAVDKRQPTMLTDKFVVDSSNYCRLCPALPINQQEFSLRTPGAFRQIGIIRQHFHRSRLYIGFFISQEMRNENIKKS